jgi:hypothetical protein
VPSAPYDSLELVVNAARSRLNDMIVAVGGDILTDTAVFTPTVINAAWRKQQDKLASLGFYPQFDEVVYAGLQACASTDPSVQTFLDWTGFNDGTTLHAGTPLPQNAIVPTHLDERIAGSGVQFKEMDKIDHALPLIVKGPWNRIWEWRSRTGGTGEGAIWMPGTTGAWDVRIRFASYLTDFVPASTTAFSAQPVPIMRCLDSFSLYVVAEVCGPRGDLDAKTVKTEADAATAILVGRSNPVVLKPAAPEAPTQ